MLLRVKSALLATAVAAVALTPAVAVVTLATADAAYANNGKGNGGGNGRGAENRDGGKEMASRGNGGGKPAWAGQGGRAAEKRQAGKDPVGNFLMKLTGQDKREARIAARETPTEFAPHESIAPSKRPARFSDMHPRDLGNMNGALNANINAVLSHIREGNWNGPVGHIAYLASADAALAGAQDLIAEAQSYETYSDAFANSGYGTLADYYAAVAADPANADADLDAAIVALGGNPPEAGVTDYADDVAYLDGIEAPDAQAVADAEAALPDLEGAQLDAELAALAYWNKNRDAAGNMSPEDYSDREAELLDDLRERLIGYEAEIGGAMDAAAAGEDSAMADDCDTDDDCVDGEELAEVIE